MIGYNNQGIKLLPYNAPIPLCDKKYALHKTWGRLRMARLWLTYLMCLPAWDFQMRRPMVT